MKPLSGFANVLSTSLTIALLLLSRTAFAGTVPLPSYPLAVKSPYLSAWLPGNYASNVATGQPEFWAGQDLTWQIVARINGKLYTLFGAPNGISGATAATTNSISFTSSHTFIYLSAGSVGFTLDFFSPVLPGTSDYTTQSLPYSYLTVSANTSSSSSQSVQVLSAIDQTWTAQNGAAGLSYNTAGSYEYFEFNNPNAIAYTEVSDQATYGSVVFATTTTTGVTHTCGSASSVYSSFASAGSFSSSAVTCSNNNLAVLAKNLGTISSKTSGSVTFAIGFDRVDAINYLGAAQTGYYRSKWSTIPSAVEFFLGNYQTAYKSSIAFDNAVRSKSANVSSDFGGQYADIIEASVRQTFGAFELTVPASNLTATPSVFLKEISSDGNVNTVDVIYQSWPIFISLNPEYIKFVFQPIISYLESGAWPHNYVIHDIGSAYPNATGHNNGVAESMPLFETSTLFILFYAYQKYTGDTTWAAQYSSLLLEYADYLAANSLYPASQLISVDAIAATPNQTALAIQSVIGLKAASLVTGKSNYSTIAASSANTIYNNALGLNGDTVASSTHFTYNYGNDSTWNVLFAAYSDVLLGLNTFPTAAWTMQSNWYLQQIQELGLPFGNQGSTLPWGLSDWNIVAAAASSTAVQLEVVNTTHAFLTNKLNTIPFGTKYYVDGPDVGQWISNKARSTVGSNFAILALDQGTWGEGY